MKKSISLILMILIIASIIWGILTDNTIIAIDIIMLIRFIIPFLPSDD